MNKIKFLEWLKLCQTQIKTKKKFSAFLGQSNKNNIFCAFSNHNLDE